MERENSNVKRNTTCASISAGWVSLGDLGLLFTWFTLIICVFSSSIFSPSCCDLPSTIFNLSCIWLGERQDGNVVNEVKNLQAVLLVSYDICFTGSAFFIRMCIVILFFFITHWSKCIIPQFLLLLIYNFPLIDTANMCAYICGPLNKLIPIYVSFNTWGYYICMRLTNRLGGEWIVYKLLSRNRDKRS